MQFVCRHVLRCGVELGPPATCHGMVCAASLESCQELDVLEILPVLHRDVE